MKAGLLLDVSILNAGLVGLQWNQSRTVHADTGVASVLRGRAFELVDDQGRVRAEIKVLPAQPTEVMPDGTRGYPEAVQLRLITSNGGPNVKLVATEDGAGLLLGGQSGYVQTLARGQTFVKVAKTNRQQKVVKQEVIQP
jgi:hypothetical protein